MVASRHSPLVFRQPWSIFWRFSTLPHKEHGLAHVLVRGLIIRTERARSRRDARPQCRYVSGCGRSRGAVRALWTRTGGSPCPLKAHATTRERARRYFVFICPFSVIRFMVVSYIKTKPHNHVANQQNVGASSA